jgi:hypothetical protein
MPCQVNFVPREPLLDLLARYGEAGLRSAVKQGVPAGIPGYPRSDSGAVFGRQAREAPPVVDTAGRERSEGDPGMLGTDA